MSTVKANTIEPASGGTVTITGASLATPALGTPASGTLTNCTGLPANTGLSGTTLASSVVNASLNAVTPTGGTLVVTGAQTVSGAASFGANVNLANAFYLTGRNAANNAYLPLIGRNASDNVVIDADGYVAVFGGVVRPNIDNAQTFGNGSYRWSVLYAGTGTINTSDEREKTPLRPLTPQELAAGLELAKLGPGVFQFLGAVAEKGPDRARLHVGYTVQQVMAVMLKHGLDPMRYAFICYDRWDAQVVHHPAVQARAAVPAAPEVWEEREVDITIRVNGEDRPAKRTVLRLVQEAQPAQPAVQAREAWTETVREAGDRYGFRPDQLDRFVSAAVIQAAIERLGL